MQFYVGVTDENWYRTLMANEAEEANFWRPGATAFRNLELGGLFLFKLKYPKNAIVGGGHFVRYLQLPTSVAWEAFKEDNGVRTVDELRRRNRDLAHSKKLVEDPEIGCIVLSGLFFWDEANWIDAPSDWSKNIVQGKGYTTVSDEGARVWHEVRQRLELVQDAARIPLVAEPVGFTESLGRRRLGQGAFRALVTDAYDRRCAITGERTLPVLQAAHIKPVTREGTHSIQNGLLLRSDLHILYDQGLITIDPGYRVHVSSQIRDRYSNGRDYYSMEGKVLVVRPSVNDFHPDPELLEWHCEEVFLQ